MHIRTYLFRYLTFYYKVLWINIERGTSRTLQDICFRGFQEPSVWERFAIRSGALQERILRMWYSKGDHNPASHDVPKFNISYELREACTQFSNPSQLCFIKRRPTCARAQSTRWIDWYSMLQKLQPLLFLSLPAS